MKIANMKIISFTGYEKTLVIIKPDAFNRRADEMIFKKIQSQGVEILDTFEGILPRQKVEVNYTQHSDKSFFREWVDFMVSGKSKTISVGGEDAISKMQKVKKEVRIKYAPDEKRYNLMHTSDDSESAEREIANMFGSK